MTYLPEPANISVHPTRYPLVLTTIRQQLGLGIGLSGSTLYQSEAVVSISSSCKTIVRPRLLDNHYFKQKRQVRRVAS